MPGKMYVRISKIMKKKNRTKSEGEDKISSGQSIEYSSIARNLLFLSETAGNKSGNLQIYDRVDS